jgi:hypothetical protein
MASNSVEHPELEMTFDINILEHLGLKMYTSLPAVVAEFVANSWDAGARVIKVMVPQTATITPNSTVSIEDNGCGLTVDEVNKKFLVVGRAKRLEEGTDIVKLDGLERKVMGSKGIGKLAGFGVAGRVVMTTIRDGHFVKFVMDYDAMKKAAQEAKERDQRIVYRPSVEDWGTIQKSNGALVELDHLKRVMTPDVDIMRRHLARRFSILGLQNQFRVYVNDQEILPADRELQAKCEIVWTIDELIREGKPWRVQGWIGSLPRHDTLADEFERGIVIMARGKLIQTPTTFEQGGRGFTGMVGTAYLVGEIHAEFLDDDTDEIATHRSSIIWESDKGQALRDWGYEKVRRICSEWVDRRASIKLKEIVEEPVYKERIAKLPSVERGVIDGFLKKLAAKEDTSPETVKDIAEFMATGAEYKGFLELVKAIEDSAPENPEVIIKFLREWEILDAVEMARIVEGRLQAIGKFQHLIDRGAREKPDIHNFLVDNPWLLDPTWNYIDDEIRYSDLLKKEFSDEDMPTADRRIDFLCLGYGNVLNVIEIKRPTLKMNVKQLRQLQDYVLFIKGHMGSGSRSYDSVVGYLIGGSVAEDGDTREMKNQWKRLEMYIYTYEELRSTAIKAHRRFLDVIQRKADRVKDLRIRESYERLRRVFATGFPSQIERAS